ncbi:MULTISPECIES: metallophosphoesterase family protein [Cyanophyceae]|uniref:Metallophosphoesterase n=1 Tax=Leptolyngbya subtilissima DQ-A4 TaxID=2933933 RepID=A0ABV0KDL1_9CYAN|nr:metallophosphoesterase [Nodosilinea sp. FACHB-141]MBD2114897.1 metallophosphoesterase [Nodosilinea sp. FACHB-141]
MPPKLVTEPSIETKIERMQQRVRWQHRQIVERGIDQTGLVIDGPGAEDETFSFLVVGDSGTGRHRSGSPQRQVAEQLLKHLDSARFTLHTGDVVYLVGSRDQYRSNFIKPYQEWLMGGDDYRKIAYDRMVFKQPILPVLGNHDYYDLRSVVGLLSGISGPLRYALRSYLDLDVSWRGSNRGDAYARAFLDYLKAVPETGLGAHLDTHYSSKLDDARALTYRPSEFTRLPNRYYTFRYGGIDFFALDSNTFNQPLPMANGEAGRKELQQQCQLLEAKKDELLRQAGIGALTPTDEDEQEERTERIEAIDEQINDITKQLNSSRLQTVDTEQLYWLRDRLIASWQNPAVRGRVLFFHHPPYVTEATKWDQGQTLAVRHHIRQVLDAVAAEVADISKDRPLVDLVLNGHAHCLDYVRTGATGHGDANIPWVICGGSGYSLRRQRKEGPELTEDDNNGTRAVAKSHLYLGRGGSRSRLKRPYSGLRVDVAAGTPPKLTVVPLVAEKYDGDWKGYEMEGIEL